MGRPKRAADGGLVYHVLNRANARMTIFENEGDYEAFERVLTEAVQRTETRLLAYCVLPNHWHLVLWPRKDGELSRFMGWLTLTHTQRWHAHRHSTGSGHVYQGRFKSFPIQEDDHLWTVLRYVSGIPCEPTWSKSRLPRDGRAYSIVSTAIGRGWWMPRPWRCRVVGCNTSRSHRPKQSWRRCDGRSCEAHRLASPRGRSGQRSD